MHFVDEQVIITLQTLHRNKEKLHQILTTMVVITLPHEERIFVTKGNFFACKKNICLGLDRKFAQFLSKVAQ